MFNSGELKKWSIENLSIKGTKMIHLINFEAKLYFFLKFNPLSSLPLHKMHYISFYPAIGNIIFLPYFLNDNNWKKKKFID